MIVSVLARLLHRLFAPKKKTSEQVDAILREKAAEYKAEHGVDLDPFSSIIDTMKALGDDPSFESRRDLWNEFGLDGEFTGTAEQNRKLIDVFREQVALGFVR